MAGLPLDQIRVLLAELPHPWQLLDRNRGPALENLPTSTGSAENAVAALAVALDGLQLLPWTWTPRTVTHSLYAGAYVERLAEVRIEHLHQADLLGEQHHPGEWEEEPPWSDDDTEIASLFCSELADIRGDSIRALEQLPLQLIATTDTVVQLLALARRYSRTATERSWSWLYTMTTSVIGVRGVASFLSMLGHALTLEPDNYDDEAWLADNPDELRGPRGDLIVYLSMVAKQLGVLVGLPDDHEEGAPGVYDLGDGRWVALGDVSRASTLFVSASTGNVELHQVYHEAAALARWANSDEGLIELGRLAEWVWLDHGFREAHLVTMNAKGWQRLALGSPSALEQIGRRGLNLWLGDLTLSASEVLLFDRGLRSLGSAVREAAPPDEAWKQVCGLNLADEPVHAWSPWAVEEDAEARWPAALDALETSLAPLHGQRDRAIELELWRLGDWMQEHEWVPRRVRGAVLERFVSLVEAAYDTGPVVMDRLTWLAKIFFVSYDFELWRRVEVLAQRAENAGFGQTADAIKWRFSGRSIDARRAELARRERGDE